MKKGIKYASVTLLVLIIAFAGYRIYKARTFKDTHDLQQQVALQCDKYIRDKNCVGMVVGIIQGDKAYSASFGHLAKGGREVDSNTIFEIGSITKVFTAVLVQMLADKGLLKWDENICDILPERYKPLVNDKTTLLSLATHTSGFPKTPQLLLNHVIDPCNPYKDMKPEDYESCIRNVEGKKKPDPGKYDYSNMGFAVLANCAEVKGGLSYDSLLQREILDRLGMMRTGFSNTDSLNFATGYNKEGNATCHWDMVPFYAGCGGLRSDITDMMKFLKANLNDGPLYKPLSETQKEVYKFTFSGVAKGWDIWTVGNAFAWKNGGTGGFKSFIAVRPEQKIGVVILSNEYNKELDKLGIDMITLASKVSLK